MERTYITIDGQSHIVEGSAEDVLRRWERAKAGGTFLGLRTNDSDRPRYVNPDAVHTIGDPIGGGGTLLWLDR